MTRSCVPVELEVTPALARQIWLRGWRDQRGPGGDAGREIEAEAIESFCSLLSVLVTEGQHVDLTWTSSPPSEGYNEFFGMSALLCSRLRLVVEAEMIRQACRKRSDVSAEQVLFRADRVDSSKYQWFDWLLEALAEQGLYVGSVLPLEFLENEEFFRDRLLQTLRAAMASDAKSPVLAGG